MFRNLTLILLLILFLSQNIYAEPKRPTFLGSCVRKLVLVVAVGTILYGGYEASQFFQPIPVHEDYLRRFSNRYSPELQDHLKYLEIFRVNSIFSSMPVTHLDDAFQWLEDKGIPISEKLKEPKYFRIETLKWIAKHDPDERARSLARRLLPTTFGDPKIYGLALEYFGNPMGYDSGLTSAEMVPRLQQFAKKGLTDQDRSALYVIETVESPVSGNVDLVHLLREAPGFLESDLQPAVKASDWIENAIQKVKKGDIELAHAIGRMVRKRPQINFHIVEILEKIGPEGLIPFLEEIDTYSAAQYLNLFPSAFAERLPDVFLSSNEHIQQCGIHFAYMNKKLISEIESGIKAKIPLLNAEEKNTAEKSLEKLQKIRNAPPNNYELLNKRRYRYRV